MKVFRAFLAVFASAALALPGLAQTAAPSPSPAGGTFVPSRLGRPIIYVLAAGSDDATRQKFVSRLTARLEQVQSSDYALQAQPSWTFNDYVNACQNQDTKGASDPVAGAFVVSMGGETIVSRSLYYIVRKSQTLLDSTLLYFHCSAPTEPAARIPSHRFTHTIGQTTSARGRTASNTKQWLATPKPAPSPTPAYYLAWKSHMVERPGSWSTATVLPFVGILLSLGATAMAFVPSKTSSSASTTVYRTPFPWSSYPPNGLTTQNVYTSGSTSNVSQVNSVANAFFVSSLTYDANLGGGVSPNDIQASRAVEKSVTAFLGEMGCPTAVSATSTPPLPSEWAPTPSAARSGPQYFWLCQIRVWTGS